MQPRQVLSLFLSNTVYILFTDTLAHHYRRFSTHPHKDSQRVADFRVTLRSYLLKCLDKCYLSTRRTFGTLATATNFIPSFHNSMARSRAHTHKHSPTSLRQLSSAVSPLNTFRHCDDLVTILCAENVDTESIECPRIPSSKLPPKCRRRMPSPS